MAGSLAACGWCYSRGASLRAIHMTTHKFITRIAPSPTGDMHLGTARTAYFNWLAAKASGGKFILRIDDTDLERSKEEHVNVILKTMEWLDLQPDETFRQSTRKARYAEMAGRLMRVGLGVVLDNGAIALRWSNDMPHLFKDTIAGDIVISDTNIEQIDKHLILIRGGDKLGQATYQFSSVVDDWDYCVNYVIRGTDHISNTPKQVAIWWALNQVLADNESPRLIPSFAHVGLIFKDKKKMSKRDGNKAASILYYKEKGYNPEALLNFMLRMGWGPKVDNVTTSILPRSLAVSMFLVGGSMRSSSANFDSAKLEWYNKMYNSKAA